MALVAGGGSGDPKGPLTPLGSSGGWLEDGKDADAPCGEVDTDVEDEGEEPAQSARSQREPEEVEEDLVCGRAAADDGGQAVAPPLQPVESQAVNFRRSRSGSRGLGGASTAGTRPASSGRTSPASVDAGDYAVPEANREVWKKFGCNTEAGRVLRKLYASRGGASEMASKVAYPRLPSPSRPWEPAAAEKKPCPQRASIRLPRPARYSPDPDDPRNWREPMYGGRKPAHQIQLEMELERPQVPNLPKGRNNTMEKRNLQDKFQFCGGRALPKGAMGHVPTAQGLPEKAPNLAAERRQRGEDGLNAEERDIFEELTLAVKRKQARIAELDAQNKMEARPTKATTKRNREALALQNEVDVCLRDIDKLLQLTDG